MSLVTVRGALVATLVFCGIGCDGGQPPDAPCPDEGTVTYTDHIRPYFFEVHCLRCHDSALTDEEERNYANPEVNFDTYGAATGTCQNCAGGPSIPEAALEQLELGTMPADRNSGGTTPTEEEIDCFRRWVEQDTPQ